MQSKRCTECGIEKPLDEFYQDRRATDGRYSRCKTCHNARMRAQRQAHPEQEWARLRAWRQAHPEERREQQRRMRQRRAQRGIVRHTLLLAEIRSLLGNRCLVCRGTEDLEVDHALNEHKTVSSPPTGA